MITVNITDIALLMVYFSIVIAVAIVLQAMQDHAGVFLVRQVARLFVKLSFMSTEY